jgi:hypothetical protein
VATEGGQSDAISFGERCAAIPPPSILERSLLRPRGDTSIGLPCIHHEPHRGGGASGGAVGSRPDLELEPSAGALPLPLLRKSSTNEARPRADNPPSDEEGLNQSQFGRSSLAVGRGVDEGEKAGARGLRGEEEGPGATAVEGAGDEAPIHIP